MTLDTTLEQKMEHSFFIMQRARPNFYKYETEFGQEKNSSTCN